MLKWSGGFWRNFMRRYPEVNAMHKRMLRVSRDVAAAGSPAAAVRELYRGQSNDAYWHGVFGGVYLPHLRGAVWQHLVAAAEAVRPAGETRVEWADHDLDGVAEAWVDTPVQSVCLAPGAGGAVAEWDAGGRNLADCMARREEPYHARLREGDAGSGVSALEEPLRVREPGLEKRLHYDHRRRLVFQAYLVRPGATLRQAVEARLPEVGDFAAGGFRSTGDLRLEREEAMRVGGRRLTVRMTRALTVSDERPELGLQLSLSAEGEAPELWLLVECNLSLPGGVADGDVCGRTLTEPVDLGDLRQVRLRQPAAGLAYELTPATGGRAWYYPVETVNNSEDGYERIVQGACLVSVHPVQLGAKPLRLRYRLRTV
jgi:alpha-amylase